MTKTSQNTINSDEQHVEKEVVIMEQRLEPHTDISIDFNETNDDSGFNEHRNERYLEDKTSATDKIVEGYDWASSRNKDLSQALASIPERERSIIELRWLNGEKQTLQELAKTLKVSTERVRQLEKKALTRLRTILQECNQT